MSKKKRIRTIFRTKQPYVQEQYRTLDNLKTLEEIYGELENVSSYLSTLSSSYTPFMYWLPKLCSVTNSQLSLADIDADISFLLDLSKPKTNVHHRDVFISAIQLADNSIVLSGSGFVLLPNSLFQDISESFLELLIFESGLHITKVPFSFLSKQIEQKLTLQFSSECSEKPQTEDEPTKPIKMFASNTNTRSELLNDPPPEDKTIKPQNFITLNFHDRNILSNHLKSIPSSYILTHLQKDTTLSSKLLKSLLPNVPIHLCYIFHMAQKNPTAMLVVWVVPKTLNPEVTIEVAVQSPGYLKHKELGWSDFRSFLRNPTMTVNAYNNNPMQNTLRNKTGQSKSYSSVVTRSQKSAFKNIFTHVSENGLQTDKNVQASSSSSTLSSKNRMNGEKTEDFEKKLELKMKEFDNRDAFVTEKLPQLLELGNTVIKIDNLPANLTVRSLNIMMGTYGIKQNQIVAMISAKGSKQKNSAGLMNLRVVLKSDDQDVQRLLGQNGRETPDKVKLQVKRTDVKDLENFLSRNYNRIHKVE